MPEKSPIERTLETLVDLVALLRTSNERNFDELKGAIGELTLNVGQLTTQQRQTATNIDRLGDRIERLITAIERQNAAIDGHLALSQAQSANIAELTRLATRLIERQAG